MKRNSNIVLSLVGAFSLIAQGEGIASYEVEIHGDSAKLKVVSVIAKKDWASEGHDQAPIPTTRTELVESIPGVGTNPEANITSVKVKPPNVETLQIEYRGERVGTIPGNQFAGASFSGKDIGVAPPRVQKAIRVSQHQLVITTVEKFRGKELESVFLAAKDVSNGTWTIKKLEVGKAADAE